ncbi:MAG: hypothetical protein ABIH68_01145 [bacterium]
MAFFEAFSSAELPSGDAHVCGSLRQSCGHTVKLLGLTAPSDNILRLAPPSGFYGKTFVTLDMFFSFL